MEELLILCGWRRILFSFLSSRRRHTRLQGDWSSDVCSSDLVLRDSCRCNHQQRARRQADLRCRSEEHTSELQSPCNLVCRLLLEKNKPFSLAGCRVWVTCERGRGEVSLVCR